MGLKYHSIPSRAESDNPMDGACVLISPARLRLGICMAVGNSLVAGIKPQLPSLVAEPALLRLQ